jgi:hypothetical protein
MKMNDSKQQFQEGVDWEEEKMQRSEKRDFKTKYTELHIRTERVDHAPGDGQIIQEGGQQATISSDGEHGRLMTQSHKTYIRCDCGCIVDSILKTRRDESEAIFCERHGNLFCRLCSLLIIPGQQVKINDSYYHRHACAENVVDHILAETENNEDTVPVLVVGELKALKSDLRAERWAHDWEEFKNGVKQLFRRKKTYAISQRR